MRVGRHGRGLFLGLTIGGAVWVLATVVAVLLQLGPVRPAACPERPGPTSSDQIYLSLVPLGPTCRLEARSEDGALTGRALVWGPDPVWSRAFGMGAICIAVGVVGLTWTRRSDRLEPRATSQDAFREG